MTQVAVEGGFTDAVPRIGDRVGKCDALVEGSGRASIVVDVHSDPDLCGSCVLSEYCSESKENQVTSL